MLHNKKIVFIVIGIILLIGIVLTIYFVEQSKPQNVIESRLNIKLPSSSKIIKYEYHAEGKYFYAKISIEEKDVGLIKKQLDDLFGGIATKNFIENIPNFENVCSWWDMDNTKIQACYVNFIDVKKWRTIIPHEVWAFISKDKEGQYYLYISY